MNEVFIMREHKIIVHAQQMSNSAHVLFGLFSAFLSVCKFDKLR